MRGQEIQELVIGKTISGTFWGFQWSIRIYENGESERSDFFGVHKGKTWIEGDALCAQYETAYDGLEICSDMYKNPEGDKNTLSEYLSLTDYGLFPFSIEE